MIRSVFGTILTIVALSGCAQQLQSTPGAQSIAKRAFADTFQDHPFDSGPVSVLAEERGELRSFTLRPCGDGRVCGAKKGRVVRTDDYWVVTGAYAYRTFYISAGGDGWLKRGHAIDPIAWN